jgi:hypothetical protein
LCEDRRRASDGGLHPYAGRSDDEGETVGSRAAPLVVTTGDAEANRKLVEQHGIRCTVLLPKQVEVTSSYRAQGIPMGDRIDAEGKFASELTVGGEALLELSRRACHRPGSSFKRHHDPRVC